MKNSMIALFVAPLFLQAAAFAADFETVTLHAGTRGTLCKIGRGLDSLNKGCLVVDSIPAAFQVELKGTNANAFGEKSFTLQVEDFRTEAKVTVYKTLAHYEISVQLSDSVNKELTGDMHLRAPSLDHLNEIELSGKAVKQNRSGTFELRYTFVLNAQSQ